MDEFIYESFNIPDRPSENILPTLKEVNEKMKFYLSQGKWVVVHCYKGISRAPTMIISYLMLFKGLSFDQAFDTVRLKAPWIDPNAGFLIQLQSLQIN